VLVAHFEEILRGSQDDWDKLKQHADAGRSLLASAIVALSYADSHILVVPNNYSLANDYGKRSLNWLIRESERGCQYTQFFLAEFNRCGVSMVGDESAYVRLLGVSAHNGYANAQYKLACCYASGVRVTKDMIEARSLVSTVG
jgi:TPR repeat protein